MSGPSKARSCNGKVRHEQRRDAEAAIKALKPLAGLQLAVYHCRFCKGYHLGHRSFRRRW